MVEKMILKNRRQAKLYTVVLLSVFLLGTFGEVVFSQQTSTTSITNIVQIARGVNAASGFSNDIQEAVDILSSSGGTVYIPAGNWSWNGSYVLIPGGVNVMGAALAGCQGHTNDWASYPESTILHENKPGYGMFVLDGSNGKPSRISGISFEASAPANTSTENEMANNNRTGVGVAVGYCLDFRIDHCTFTNWVNMAVMVNTQDTPVASRGVIDHCVVDNPYKLSGSGWLWGYGFYAGNDWYHNHFSSWSSNVSLYAGHYGDMPSYTTVMVVEDCHMLRCRHATDGIEGAWGIIRFNLIESSLPPYGDADSHGSASWVSARGFEVYSNTFLETPLDDGDYGNGDIAVRLRDGSGLVYNNDFVVSPRNIVGSKPAYFIYLDNDDATGGNLWPMTYLNDTYIWSNSFEGSNFLNNQGGYIQNVNYYLRAPNQAQDMFSYTPYAYPAPITMQP